MICRFLRPTLAVLAALLFLAAPVGAQTIIAVVNEDVVTDRDVEQRVRLALLFTGQPPTAENAARLRPQVIRALVDQQLQMQEARRLGLEVAETDIDAEIANLADRNNLTPEQLNGILERVGVAPETLRAQIRTQIAWSLVAGRQLLPRVVVSDVQLAQSLRQANTGEVEYRLAEIFLPIYEPTQEIGVLDDARRLREAVATGADFGALAEQVSVAPSAERGGDLGWLPESGLPEELRDVIATLPEGGISQPIRTPDGVYLFRRLDRRQGSSGLTVTLRRIDVSGENQVGDQPLRPFVEEARADAQSCPALDALLTEVEAPAAAVLAGIDPASLDEPLATAALTQPVGVLSGPLNSADGTILVMVCSRTGGADGEARERALEQLRLEALERLATRYLRNLRQDAFIDVRSVPG